MDAKTFHRQANFWQNFRKHMTAKSITVWLDDGVWILYNESLKNLSHKKNGTIHLSNDRRVEDCLRNLSKCGSVDREIVNLAHADLYDPSLTKSVMLTLDKEHTIVSDLSNEGETTNGRFEENEAQINLIEPSLFDRCPLRKTQNLGVQNEALTLAASMDLFQPKKIATMTSNSAHKKIETLAKLEPFSGIYEIIQQKYSLFCNIKKMDVMAFKTKNMLVLYAINESTYEMISKDNLAFIKI